MRHPPLNPRHPHLIHGADWNPDQWLERPEIIDEDFAFFPRAGLSHLSVGIFAWAAVQPSPEVWTFDWLDRIMDRLAAAGRFAILATPSAGKPAWLAQAHPEVQRVWEAGNRSEIGGRMNHCWTSPVFHKHVAEVNGRLAERYGKHPALAMWHVSNEANGACYCNLCRAEWHRWLQRKYGSLAELNRRWWAPFWSHTYTDWAQIDPKDHCLDGMWLDWRRFTSEHIAGFLAHEIAALRRHSPDVPVTTNFMGSIPDLDYWRFAPVLDVISNDAYPVYQPGEHLWIQASNDAFNFDLDRSLKGNRPWLCMESTPSTINWGGPAKLKRPGIHALEMLQNIAHGADGVCYFQWRKGRGGHEKYHGAVVGHDRDPEARVFREVQDVSAMLGKLDAVVGTPVPAEVGLVFDWESDWAIRSGAGIRDRRPGLPWGQTAYQGACKDHYRGAWGNGLPVQMINGDGDPTPFRLLIAPAMYLLRPGMAERLAAWVRGGGILVSTYLCGMVDEDNLVLEGGWPGHGLSDVFGVRYQEIDFLPDHDHVPLAPAPGNALGWTAAVDTTDVCCLLQPQGAETIACYAGEFYAGTPAITAHRHGAGTAYFVGAQLPAAALVDLYRRIADRHGLRRAIPGPLPLGVTAQVRSDGSTEHVFLLNFTGSEQTIDVGPGCTNTLGQTAICESRVVLPTHGVAVLRRPAHARP